MTPADFTAIINQLLPEPHAGLLAGIVFGTKATLSKDLTENLIRTGTLHIVALSGMNITIMTSLVNKSLLWIIPRQLATVITILLIAGFVWFVGPSPSIVRAAVMGTITLLAIIFGRQAWALWAWFLAVTIMLLLNFSWITDLSFQLSTLATLGIILFGGKQPALLSAGRSAGNEFFRDARQLLLSSLKFLYSLVKDDLRTTLAAQVFTIPLILFTFGRISLVSPVTNILIGWTIAPLTVAGWLVAILGWLWLPLGQIVAWFTWVWLEYLLIVINWTSKIPGASLRW